MTVDLIATYRLQLRNGVDFATARSLLPMLRELGISHLYLSPIFTATEGSTHGYDIIDPTEIDPVLGGEEGFRDLALAARDAGLGVILDIVPNHTAFSLENPWLRDVLRHGAQSAYADFFDIDMSQRIVLPWLSAPFAELAEKGEIRVGGDAMQIGDLSVPLVPGTGDGTVEDVHEAQHWSLTHWRYERDGITHRRFFSVTGLIGMRVEDRAVFEAMHAKLFELLDAGLVQGVRVDHIDGLADPALYLERLADRVGDVPVWVEKILAGDETLPDWAVAGTTGYEAARQIVRVLTHPEGHARLVERWCRETGMSADFEAAVKMAKREVLGGELAAELHQLIALAEAVSEARAAELGPESLREAIIALLKHVPRYRTYFADDYGRTEDVRLMEEVAEEAGEDVPDRRALDLLTDAILSHDTPEEKAFTTRFQQVTGALIAKAHEDTAAFRQTAYLALCEVGCDPDEPTIGADDMRAWCRSRVPTALTLTSSHDTKRSEDARMRLVAMSHAPEAALDLIERAARLPEADGVAARDLWYAVQAALGIWDEDAEDLEIRLSDHLCKALREAKIITKWTDPDEEAEESVLRLGAAILADWKASSLGSLLTLVTRAEPLIAAQVIMKFMIPGVPDIYQSCVGTDFSLTDPDNRRPVDFEGLGGADGVGSRKAALTHDMLALRRAYADLFATAGCDWSHDVDRIHIVRADEGTRMSADMSLADGNWRISVNGEPWATSGQEGVASRADDGKRRGARTVP